MTARSIEEFLASLERRGAEEDEQERELLGAAQERISAVRSAVAAGAKLRAAAEQDSAAHPRRRFCTQCGARLAAGNRFCTKCGSPVE
jgi:hypothetical protein